MRGGGIEVAEVFEVATVLETQRIVGRAGWQLGAQPGFKVCIVSGAGLMNGPIEGHIDPDEGDLALGDGAQAVLEVVGIHDIGVKAAGLALEVELLHGGVAGADVAGEQIAELLAGEAGLHVGMALEIPAIVVEAMHGREVAQLPPDPR